MESEDLITDDAERQGTDGGGVCTARTSALVRYGMLWRAGVEKKAGTLSECSSWTSLGSGMSKASVADEDRMLVEA